MCVDCVLASLRITQVDPGDEPLSDVVLSQWRPSLWSSVERQWHDRATSLWPAQHGERRKGESEGGSWPRMGGRTRDDALLSDGSRCGGMGGSDGSLRRVACAA
jgi:hypothetical protein